MVWEARKLGIRFVWVYVFFGVSVAISVTFPLFEKIDVNGSNRHPLYIALAGKDSPYPGDIKWNFGKFLIGRDGKIIKRFEPKTVPDAPEVVAAIEAALAAK